jgi:GlpG protein
MRHLADLKNKKHAESFVAHLLTLGISTHVEHEGTIKQSNGSRGESDECWSLWVRDEDRLPEAIAEWNRFQSEPDNPKYSQAIQGARAIVQQKRTEQKLREKNIRTLRPTGNPMMGGRLPPLTLALVIICVVLGLVAGFANNLGPGNTLGRIAMQELKFVDMSLYNETKDPAASLKKFELWRLLTPAFLHGDAIHLLLNMFSLASLGRLTEKLEGVGKYSILLIIMALGSHLPQGLLPSQFYGNPNFVGISGVVMGLFGYLAVKSRLRPDCGFFFPPDAYVMIGMLLVLGFAMPNGLGMANVAHLGGLVTGAIVGLVWNR